MQMQQSGSVAEAGLPCAGITLIRFNGYHLSLSATGRKAPRVLIKKQM